MSTVKKLGIALLSQENLALRTLLIKAFGKLGAKSRYANVALGVVHKAQGEAALAADAYLAAGAKSQQPSAYQLMAVKVLLAGGHTTAAIAEVMDLAAGKQNPAWLEHLAEAIILLRQDQDHLAPLLSATEQLASQPKHQHVAGLIFFYAHAFDKANELLKSINWQRHPLRNSLAFRTLASSQQNQTTVSGNGQISAADIFGLLPCSVRDYQAIDFDQQLNAIDILRGDGHKRLFAKKLGAKVYVIAEPGADLTPRTDDEMQRSYTIFANGDAQVKAAAEVGMHTLSIKDLVPDQSPVVDNLYAHAARLASHIVKVVTDNMMPRRLSHFIASHRSTFEMLLEDHIARELLDIEWYISALRAVPADGDALLIAADGNKILSLLPWLLSQLPAERLFLQAPDPSASNQQQVVHAYRQVAMSGREVGRIAAPWSNGTPAANIDATAEALEQWWHDIDAGVREQARADSANQQADACLMIGNLLDRNYADGNCELTTRLQKTRSMLVLSTAIEKSEAWNQAEIEDRLSNVKIRSLPAMARDEVNKTAAYDAGRQLTRLLLENSEIKALTYQGRSVARTLGPALWKWCRSDIPIGLIEYSYLTTAMGTERYASLLVTPGRGRAARLAAVIARTHKVHSIDVQMVNTPGYRKYKAPITDKVTAIDHVAEELLTGYFQVPAEKIHTIGSPKLDMFRSAVADIDPAKALATLGLSNQPGPIICFASQLQPIEQCVAIVQTLVDYVAANSHARLIVKLHPREDEARQAAYTQVIQAAGAGDRIILAKGPNMQEIYRVTNLLVTMYSNAAREALVLGREVIIANFTGKPWPMRFDLPGLAKGAYSPAELREKLEESSESFLQQDEPTLDADDYLSKNPHLTQSKASDLLAELLNQAKQVSQREVS